MAFLNGLLLFGAALGAVPIVIHLLNKQRFRPVKWAAMEFLLEAIKQNSKRLQIRDIIMMLIRTLAVIFLALALARPTIASKIDLLWSGANSGAVILLDNSLSLGYSNGKDRRFDTARKRIKEILALLDSGTWVKVITFNGEARAPLGDPTQNVQFVEKELDTSIYISEGATDIETALRETHKLFKNHPEFKLASKEIYLVSDLQGRSWNPKHVSGNFSSSLEALSKEAAFYVIDIGDAGIENAALVNLVVSEPLAVVDMPIAVSAEIQNFGQADISGLTVDFFVDGEDKAVKRSTVDLGPGERTSVDFETVFQDGGDHRVEVRLGADRLEQDNKRFVTIDVMEEARFLLVDGGLSDSDDPLAGETGFLRFALSPYDIDNPDRLPVVQTEVISIYQLAEKNLSNYQGVALCNVEAVPSGAIKLLNNQVRAGMGLLIFLGDRTDPENWNALLGKKGVGLLPAKIEDTWGELPKIEEEPEKPEDDDKEEFRVFAGDIEKISHPVMAFFNTEAARPLLGMVKIFKGFTLKLDEESEEEKKAREEALARKLEREAKAKAEGKEVELTEEEKKKAEEEEKKKKEEEEKEKADDRKDEDGGSTVVAYYDTGEPAIFEKAVGAGRVILFPFPATTLDTKGWSNLPAHYVFPILMNRLATRLALGNRPSRNVAVGDPLIGTVSREDQRRPVRIEAPIPIGKQETQSEVTDDGLSTFSYGLTDKAGFYKVSIEGSEVPSMTFSVNSPTKVESFLERVSVEQIRMDYPNFKFTYIGMGDDPAGALRAERRGTEIWPWFLIVVFLLLALESFLAHRWAPRD